MNFSSGSNKPDKPEVKVPYKMGEIEREQESVDKGHSPWKLDPAFVAEVFASLLLSPEGIVGAYPIAYEEVEIIYKEGKQAIVQIHNEKSIASKVYLRRFGCCDGVGIWFVTGYDKKQ